MTDIHVFPHILVTSKPKYPIESTKTASMENFSTEVREKMIWCIKTCIIAYVKIQKKWRYSIQYVKPTAQLVFKNLDQHAGGKWLIHDTKRRKDNKLQSLKLPCRISKLSSWMWHNGSDGTMLNPIFWKKVQRQKHPGRWGFVEHSK